LLDLKNLKKPDVIEKNEIEIELVYLYYRKQGEAKD